MFSFYIPEGENPEDYRDEVIRRLEAFMDETEGTGITLLHENEKDIYGDTPERCLDIIESIDRKCFKAIFDPANFIQIDAETYPLAFDLMKEHVLYMHIKDARYSDHQVVPAGQGDGKIKEILTELRDRGFKGFLSLEPHLANFVGFATLEQGDVGADMPDGGEKEFTIAAHALKDIISKIGR